MCLGIRNGQADWQQAGSLTHLSSFQGKVAAVGGGWTTEAGVKIAIDEVSIGDKIMFRYSTIYEQGLACPHARATCQTGVALA